MLLRREHSFSGYQPTKVHSGHPMHTANSKRIAWFMQLQRILQFQKQHLAPRHAALRLRRPTKGDFFYEFSGCVALPERAAVSEGRNGTLAPGNKQFAFLDGPISSSGKRAAYLRPLANKMDIVGYEQIRTGRLADRHSVKSLAIEHQLLQRRYQLQSVRSVQIPTLVGDAADHFPSKILGLKDAKSLARPLPIREIASSSAATPKRFTLGNAPSLPVVENARTSRLPGARYPLVAIEDEGSPRARPPRTEEQFGLNGLANLASQLGQESRTDTPGYQPQLHKASSSSSSSAVIHIDGSVLGRWAIQHLERSLGKPPTGMTGVDPRASKPRSRVSPYVWNGMYVAM